MQEGDEVYILNDKQEIVAEGTIRKVTDRPPDKLKYEVKVKGWFVDISFFHERDLRLK